MKKILITGGAGYIGSQTNKVLNENGYETIILDNLKNGHRELVKWGRLVVGDIHDKDVLDKIFSEYDIEAVIHFAAYAYVGESVIEPHKYYQNNVVGTILLLETMLKHDCKKIIFSSTCATFGKPKQIPISETEHQCPINPYGNTKLMIEQVFKDYSKAYGLKFVVLRYFNAAGADPQSEVGEWHVPETHIIPLILDVAIGKKDFVEVFGMDYNTKDGTCIRDYVHVYDLAYAHLLSLRYLQSDGKSEFFNLGNGKGYSVLELIETSRKITRQNIEVKLIKRREGDPPILIANSQKAERILKWKPIYKDIESIVTHAWNWHVKLKNI